MFKRPWRGHGSSKTVLYIHCVGGRLMVVYRGIPSWDVFLFLHLPRDDSCLKSKHTLFVFTMASRKWTPTDPLSRRKVFRAGLSEDASGSHRPWGFRLAPTWEHKLVGLEQCENVKKHYFRQSYLFALHSAPGPFPTDTVGKFDVVVWVQDLWLSRTWLTRERWRTGYSSCLVDPQQSHRNVGMIDRPSVLHDDALFPLSIL